MIFFKLYLENICQTINSTVGLTILWIAKKKKKKLYLNTLNTQSLNFFRTTIPG